MVLDIIKNAYLPIYQASKRQYRVVKIAKRKKLFEEVLFTYSQ